MRKAAASQQQWLCADASAAFLLYLLASNQSTKLVTNLMMIDI
jgi:hypothetical protein